MDLTTSANVRNLIGKDVTDKDEPLLQTLATAASAFIEGRCGRSFGVQQYTDTFNGREVYKQKRIVLRNSPVVSVSDVVLDGTSIPQRATFGDGGWVFDTQTDSVAFDQPFFGYWYFGVPYWGLIGLGIANVTITYTAGFNPLSGTQTGGALPVPSDLVFAASELAALWYRERNRIGIVQMHDGNLTTMYQVLNLPLAVAETIKRYSAPVVG